MARLVRAVERGTNTGSAGLLQSIGLGVDGNAYARTVIVVTFGRKLVVA
jgi:hypothetical protein